MRRGHAERADRAGVLMSVTIDIVERLSKDPTPENKAKATELLEMRRRDSGYSQAEIDAIRRDYPTLFVQSGIGTGANVSPSWSQSIGFAPSTSMTTP